MWFEAFECRGTNEFVLRQMSLTEGPSPSINGDVIGGAALKDVVCFGEGKVVAK